MAAFYNYNGDVYSNNINWVNILRYTTTVEVEVCLKLALEQVYGICWKN